MNKGFSLIELMVTVGIVAILASLATTKFKTFQLKAYRAEAYSNLGMIYTLNASALASSTSIGTSCTAGCWVGNNSIGGPVGGCKNTPNSLGFSLSNCSPTGARTPSSLNVRYEYTWVMVGESSFEAQATSGFGSRNKIAPSCYLDADTWKIYADKTITNPQDILKASCF